MALRLARSAPERQRRQLGPHVHRGRSLAGSTSSTPAAHNKKNRKSKSGVAVCCSMVRRVAALGNNPLPRATEHIGNPEKVAQQIGNSKTRTG